MCGKKDEVETKIDLLCHISVFRFLIAMVKKHDPYFVKAAPLVERLCDDARHFIIERRFDPDEIAKFYRVPPTRLG
jgi:hypothetical protein